jgi:hypothetical protein
MSTAKLDSILQANHAFTNEKNYITISEIIIPYSSKSQLVCQINLTYPNMPVNSSLPDNITIFSYQFHSFETEISKSVLTKPSENDRKTTNNA